MNKETMLPVMERFYTLQGEGYYSGRAAYFIRLSGCDVGCHWCDVKESWEIAQDQYMEISRLVSDAKESGTEIVVVTGGEPFTHNLIELTKQLKEAGLRTHVETAGVFPITGDWDWICLSPKKFKPVLEEYYKKADELKVVIFNQSDFMWAEDNQKKLNKNCRLYLQPEWSKEPELKSQLIHFIKENTSWIYSMQTHKYLSIE